MAAVPSGRASEVERSAAPEADATRALYERYAGQLYGFCLHRLGSREEAEDAVQTTFLNAFRGLRRGVVPEAEGAWLFKIAENVCLTRHRSSWRRGRVEAPSDLQAFQDVTPARAGEGGDELIPLSDALTAMPEAQRRAILLREWQGLSYKEIADEMDVSQSAVETLIFRARRSLANALETPWQERRAAGVGRRAFDLGSLLAALKGLFAGGAAAKVAILAVAATGTVALAVADAHHEARPPARGVPSAGAARAPDSIAPRPLAAASDSPLASERKRAVERNPADRPSAAVRAPQVRRGRPAPAAGGESSAPERGAGTPAGGAKEPETRAAAPASAEPAEPKATTSKSKPKPKPKHRAKPAAKAKPRRTTEPRPKPKAQQPTPAQPKPEEPQATAPPPPASPAFAPAPPPPPPPPPAEDKPKEKGKGE